MAFNEVNVRKWALSTASRMLKEDPERLVQPQYYDQTKIEAILHAGVEAVRLAFEAMPDGGTAAAAMDAATGIAVAEFEGSDVPEALRDQLDEAVRIVNKEEHDQIAAASAAAAEARETLLQFIKSAVKDQIAPLSERVAKLEAAGTAADQHQKATKKTTNNN